MSSKYDNMTRQEIWDELAKIMMPAILKAWEEMRAKNDAAKTPAPSKAKKTRQKTGKRKIKVVIMSSNAHDSFLMTPEEALAFARDRCSEGQMWSYLDGNYFDPLDVTEHFIAKGRVLRLTNALVGG